MLIGLPALEVAAEQQMYGAEYVRALLLSPHLSVRDLIGAKSSLPSLSLGTLPERGGV